MVLRRAEAPQFFQKGKEAILAEKIHDAGEANLLKLLDELSLSKNDLVVSKLGRNLIVTTTCVQGIGKIRDLSAELEGEHVVEVRCLGMGRRINEKVSIVDELVIPIPNKILVTTEKFFTLVEKAVEYGNKRAIQILRENENKDLLRDFTKNKDVNCVNDLLEKDWEQIASRTQVKMTAKLSEKLPLHKLILDVHTHDKAVGESDIPSIKDYIAVRKSIFHLIDWLAVCKTTNIDSLKSANLFDDLLFFYAGKGTKPYLQKINEIKKIRDEEKRFGEEYELRFDIYRNLRATVCTYGQILEAVK